MNEAKQGNNRESHNIEHFNSSPPEIVENTDKISVRV